MDEEKENKRGKGGERERGKGGEGERGKGGKGGEGRREGGRVKELREEREEGEERRKGKCNDTEHARVEKTTRVWRSYETSQRAE